MKSIEEIKARIQELQDILDSFEITNETSQWDADTIRMDTRIVRSEIATLKWVLE